MQKEKVNLKKLVSERSGTSGNLGSSFIEALLLDAYQEAKAVFIYFSKENKSESAAAFGITIYLIMIHCHFPRAIRLLQWSNYRMEYIG